MQMKNRLPGARTYVQHSAVAILNRTLSRNVRSCKVAASHQFRIFSGGFLQAGNMFLGDDQHVRRTLWVQILKGKSVLVFKNFLRWNFASNNAAE